MKSKIWEEIKDDPDDYTWRCAGAAIVIACIGGLIALIVLYPKVTFIVGGSIIGGAALILAAGAFTYKIDDWFNRK